MNEKTLNLAIELLIKYITDANVEEIASVEAHLMELRDLI